MTHTDTDIVDTTRCTNKPRNRVRFMANERENNSIREAANRYGRPVSELIRVIILKSTNNLTDFSILDNDSIQYSKPRYFPIESSMSVECISSLVDAAKIRFRTVPAFTYYVVNAATYGFTDYSIVE